MGGAGVSLKCGVVEATALDRFSMLLTYIILSFTGLAGAAIAQGRNEQAIKSTNCSFKPK